MLTHPGCLLTGRNHHALGLAAITELSLGYPSLDGVMGFEHGFVSETLVEQGYNTFAVGKWHLTPSQETTPAGPFNRWPLGRGFERFYGFMGGDTDQFHPDLVHDNHSVRQPATPAEGYHLNADIADHAIAYIGDAHTAAPDKPFFLWYATGAGHAPHQVEPEWVERYHGAFDMGWDEYRRIVFDRQRALGLLAPGAELSLRDPDVEPWDELSDDAKRMYTRQMEVYAGFLTQTDHHIGRVLDFIERIGELDNTLVVAVSDNGASAEGGEHGTRNEGMFFNLAPETLEDNLAVIDQWGERGHVQPLLVGVDVGRRHALPALEARDLPGRHHRPLHRVLARRHRRPGRGPPPVRPRHRPGPDPAGRHRDPGPRRTSGRGPVGAARHQPGPDLHRPRRPRRPHHPVLRDVRPPLDLPRGLEGGLPLPGTEPGRGRRARPPVRHAPDRGHPGPTGGRGLGAVRPHLRSVGVPRPRRRPARRSWPR